MAKTNGQGNGFKARLAQAIIYTVLSVALFWWNGYMINTYPGTFLDYLLITIIATIVTLFALLQYIFAFKGRKSRAANILSIIINIPFMSYIIGIPGLIGGIFGLKALPKKKKLTLADFPIDYTNKPIVSKLLDHKNFEVDVEDGTDAEFTSIFVTLYNENLYAYAIVTSEVEEDNGKLAILLVDYENDTCSTVTDMELFSKLFEIYKADEAERIKKFTPEDVLEAFPPNDKPRLTSIYKGENFDCTNDDSEKLWEFQPVQFKIYGGELYFLAKYLEVEEKGNFIIFKVDYENDDINSGFDDELADEIFEAIQADLATQNKQAVKMTEYIQSKTSPRAKKATMVIVLVSYMLLLIAGILLAAVPSMGNIIHEIGICKDVSARAYGITIGTLWVALTPTVGYYFATVAPTKLAFKGKIILAIASTAVLAGLNVVFFVIANTVQIDGIAVKEYYENSDTWFIPVTMICSSVGLIISYALTLFRLNPEKLKLMTVKSNGNDYEPFQTKHLRRFINGLSRFFTVILRGILKFKEKRPELFIIIATVLFTWLAYFVAFIVAIICIFIFVGVLVMVFAGILDSGYKPSQPQLQVYDNGYMRTLTYCGGYLDKERYKDDIGNYWLSDKDGNVYRDK